MAAAMLAWPSRRGRLLARPRRTLVVSGDRTADLRDLGGADELDPERASPALIARRARDLGEEIGQVLAAGRWNRQTGVRVFSRSDGRRRLSAGYDGAGAPASSRTRREPQAYADQRLLR